MRLHNPYVRYFLISAGIVIMVLVVLTAVYKDRVAEIVIEAINSRSDVKVSVSGGKLTLLKRFPRASFQLNDVLITGSDEASRDDTIAAVSLVSLEFRIINLIRKKYTIEWIKISDGTINIITDKTGTSNLPKFKTDTHGNEPGLNIDLKNIGISNIGLLISNRLKETETRAYISTARLTGKIAGSDIGLKAEGDFTVEKLMMNGININQPVNAAITLDMFKSDTTLTMRKGTLTLEQMSFTVAGNYYPDSGETSITISSENADITSLAGFMPEKSGSWLKYRPAGKVSANCKIEGILSNESKLNYEVAFSMTGIKLIMPGKGVRFNNSSLSGYYTNGKENNASSSQLVLDNIDLKTENSFVTGSASINNFVSYRLNGEINAAIDLAELSAILTGTNFTDGSGKIRASVKVNGEPGDETGNGIRKFIAMSPKGNAWFSSASFTVNQIEIRDATGNMMLSEHLWIDSLSADLNGQRFLADGKISNFNDWVLGKADIVKIEGFLGSPLLQPELIIEAFRKEGSENTPIRLPSGYSVNVNLSADEFRYRKFTAYDASCKVQYASGRLKLDNLILSSMGGELEGSGVLVQKGFSGFGTESSLIYRNVDINSAFVSFGNFRQDFIKAENLRGTISGKYDMRMDLDTLFMPDFYSISSEGQFVIDNGEMISFEPIMKMSRFIEISELENIRFSRLENEFFINSGTFAIPQMEIKSSAADLGIYGKHSFNGDYEYHLKVLLSQVLSRKAPRRTPGNEFGIIQDDGLGRTSLFLLLNRKGEKETVSYDRAAVKSEVRQDLQKEKQTLRGILNEEYGWYGGDTTLNKKVEEKPKFRIIWDEDAIPDTLQKDTLMKPMKNSPVRNIFKKIIKGEPS